MTSRLNPYLNFSDNAREAMEFYQSVLGGELTISTFGEYGGAPQGLSEDDVMHAMLVGPDDFALMASDTPGGMSQDSGHSGRVSLSLSGDEATRLRGYFEKLSEGGTVSVPLEKQMWGDEFGMLVDRFGIAWMVDIYPGEASS
jgi:PhnB protein